MELFFQEGDFLVKELSAPEELDAAYRLRHRVFVDELRWVPPCPDGLEKDFYDDFAHPIGVFDHNGRLVCHVRLITAPKPFMIEKEFAVLLPKDRPFKKISGMVESTRICVEKEYRTTMLSSMTLAHLLYKAMYHWSKENGYRYLVTIVEKRYYILLKRSRFPFKQVGDFLPLGEGVMSGIVMLDWNEVDVVVKEKRPDFFDWLVNLQAPCHRQLQLRALY